jgi:hypothetical protein
MASLSYDGRGINGPAPDRARVATFTDSARADEWGPLLAAAPELLAALRYIVHAYPRPLDGRTPVAVAVAEEAIAKAEGRA